MSTDLTTELAAIRERSAVARLRAKEDEADLAHRPTRLMSQSQFDRRLLARDNARLLAALEAVVESLNETVNEKVNYDRMQGYEIHQHDGEVNTALELRDVITTALTETEEES